ncbi:MAG TPA: dienelactone hydrolase family protein [Vicinamibacteria bacterium]|nr:dienelactone hydrolase family protein [Vicinamibacteria bacterium]
MSRTFAALAALTLSMPAVSRAADVKTQPLEYRQGDAVLEGVLAWDASASKPRPGIIVVPDWMGVGPNAKRRAEQLAALGYVALVADVYGKGVRPKDGKEAGALAGQYRSGDRAVLRARMSATLDALRKAPGVDPARIAVIGYCFGGSAALELARSGADVKGVVTFHGGLAPGTAPSSPVKAKVLVLHGADDPFVTPAEVSAFEDEMRKGGVDWQLVKYSGAVHSFTIPDAGNDNSKGAAYNAVADRRSFDAMKAFFAEIFPG